MDKKKQIDVKLNEWHPFFQTILRELELTAAKLPDREADSDLYIRLVGDQESLIKFYMKIGGQGSKQFLNQIEDHTSLIDNPAPSPIEIDFHNIPGVDAKFYVHVRSSGTHVELLEAPSEYEALKDFCEWSSYHANSYALETISAKCTNQSMTITFWQLNGQLTIREIQ